MDPPEPALTLLLVVALVLANAFFVAAEFSLIALRRPRSEPVSRPGESRLARAVSALQQVNTLTLAAQVGRSAASLALGFVAMRVVQPVLADAIPPGGDGNWPLLLQGAAAVTVLLIVAVHVVIGEQVPKLLAAGGGAERISRFTLVPLRIFAWVLIPVIWPLERVVGGVVRLFGAPSAGFHPLVHTSEEIRLLVAQSSEQGGVEDDEREMIQGVFEFSDTVAREVMTPRTDMVAVPAEIGLRELLDLVIDEGHSRLPVFEGTIDAVVGILLAKDLLPLLRAESGDRVHGFDIRSLMREPYFVPDAKPVDDLLAEFRQHGVHLAIVLDEFGGTYGLVTLEDLLEEIVGEIHDEYDVAEPDFAATPEGDIRIDGGTAISEVNERCGTGLPEEDFDTIGGFIFGALGRVPTVGDAVRIAAADGEMELRVEEMEERRVLAVRLTRPEMAADPAVS
jgi:CBS domain containing-hemolysin-like protein